MGFVSVGGRVRNNPATIVPLSIVGGDVSVTAAIDSWKTTGNFAALTVTTTGTVNGGTSVTGGFFATTAANQATIGDYRSPNNTTVAASRNALNTANVITSSVNNVNRIIYGNAGGGSAGITLNDDVTLPAGTDLNLANNRNIYFKDSGGTARTVIGLSSGDVTKVNSPVTGQLEVATVAKVTWSATAVEFASANIVLGAGGPTITAGAGVPGTTPPDGSIYLRTDGTSITTIYVRAAGAWTANP